MPLLVEIEDLLELLIQCNAEYQSQLGSGVELSRLDGTYGISGHADHVGELLLRQSRFITDLFEMIS